MRWRTAVLLIASTISACHHSGSIEARQSAASGTPIAFALPSGEHVAGDIYGAGDRAVAIIAQGGYSTRASWRPHAQTIAAAGYRVLVFESRAAADYAAGKETACMYDEVCQAQDVLAAVRYLHGAGARTIAVMGGSMGGGAVAQAAVEAADDEIDRIVLLAPAEIASPERMRGRKLFIVTRNDANAAGLRLAGIQRQYDRSPAPKRLLLLEGDAHGQRVFLSPEGERAMREILRFLGER